MHNALSTMHYELCTMNYNKPEGLIRPQAGGGAKRNP